jgi:Secretion system C-terminal sorting domain
MNTNVKFITIPINSSTDIVKIEVKSSEVCPMPATMVVIKNIDSVKQGPYVDVLPNKYISFCQGDSFEVKAYNGAANLSYLWSNGLTSSSFYSKTTESYTLKVTQPGNACPRYYGPLTTSVNVLPIKPEIESNNGILKASLSDAYQWQLSKLDIIAATNQFYKYPISGKYRVSVKNMAGCINYSDELMVYPLSVKNGEKGDKISIFPNPSTGIFTVKSESNKIESISIFDLYGKQVYLNTTKEMVKQVQVERLPKGNYIIKINTSTDSYQEKIELR